MLVALAWSALATAITPLLYLFIRKHKVNEWLAIVMVVAGTATAFWWYLSGHDPYIWPSLPGIAVVMLIYISYRIVSKLQK